MMVVYENGEKCSDDNFTTALSLLIAHQFGLDVGIVDVVLFSIIGILVDSYIYFRKLKTEIDQQLSSRSTAGNDD